VSHSQRGDERIQVIHPEFAADLQSAGPRITNPQLAFVVSVELGDHNLQRLAPEIQPAVLLVHSRPREALGDFFRRNRCNRLRAAGDSQLIAGRNDDFPGVFAGVAGGLDSNGLQQTVHYLTKVDIKRAAATGDGAAADQANQT
jgi:hypothetical protein